MKLHLVVAYISQRIITVVPWWDGSSLILRKWSEFTPQPEPHKASSHSTHAGRQYHPPTGCAAPYTVIAHWSFIMLIIQQRQGRFLNCLFPMWVRLQDEYFCLEYWCCCEPEGWSISALVQPAVNKPKTAPSSFDLLFIYVLLYLRTHTFQISVQPGDLFILAVKGWWGTVGTVGWLCGHPITWERGQVFKHSPRNLLLRSFGPLFLIKLLLFSEVCVHLSKHSFLKVPPQQQAEVWILYHLDSFFFQPFCCRLAAMLGIIA